MTSTPVGSAALADHPRLTPWARFGRADARLGTVLRDWLFDCRLSRRAFYGRNLGVFLLVLLVFYRVFPRFLMQNVDGVNLYFVLDKLLLWRSSPWETTTFTPLESMAAPLWFPLNPLFVPPFASFALTADPTLRVYLLAIFASLSIFLASLLFYRAMGFGRVFGVAAAWLCFALVMLQDTNLLQGTNNVQVMAWAYVCLALLAWIGRQRGWQLVLVLALFQLGFVAYVLGDSVWHLITLPVFGLLALAIVLGAASARERWLKLASLTVAVGVQLALRTYESLYYTLADTTRSVLPSEYAGIARSASSAGLLFRGDTIELACAAWLILGLAIAPLVHLSSRPRQTRLLVQAAVAFYVLVTAAGLVYIYAPWAPAFRTGYIVEMAYPIAALFMAGAVWRLYGLVRPANGEAPPIRVETAWLPILAGILALAVFGAWHVTTSRTSAGRLADVLWVAVGILLLVRFGWARTAMVVAAVLAMVVLQQHIDSSYGIRGGDVQFDGVKRMQLGGNDLVRQLASQTQLQPGDTFRGYVEDVYQRLPAQGNVGDELVEHWHYNWDHFGNGQTLFSWGLFDIPTISEYDPFVKPLYYLFFTRLLNEPHDQQLDNYLGATRVNPRIMALMGVRYIVTDRDDVVSDREDADGLQEVTRSGPFRLLQTSNPNLGSYSPTEVVPATTAAASLTQLAQDGFDPQRQVVVTDPSALPSLVPATPGALNFDAGGFRVSASSSGWSLLVLPVQYSHCLVLTEPAPADAQLMRVNLAQTGLVFHGSLAARVEYRHWPLASPACQAQDYADTRALQLGALQR